MRPVQVVIDKDGVNVEAERAKANAESADRREFDTYCSYASAQEELRSAMDRAENYKRDCIAAERQTDQYGDEIERLQSKIKKLKKQRNKTIAAEVYSLGEWAFRMAADYRDTYTEAIDRAKKIRAES